MEGGLEQKGEITGSIGATSRELGRLRPPYGVGNRPTATDVVCRRMFSSHPRLRSLVMRTGLNEQVLLLAT